MRGRGAKAALGCGARFRGCQRLLLCLQMLLLVPFPGVTARVRQPGLEPCRVGCAEQPSCRPGRGDRAGGLGGTAGHGRALGSV